MMGNKALVVFSGGQDSTIALYWAMHNFKEVYAISFDYGQKHNRELDSAVKIANMANVPHTIWGLGEGILSGRSPLTNSVEKLEQYNSYEEMQRIIGNRVELTFVPMRNALFLVLAANRAHTMGADAIVCGVCQADGANYPDCTQEFLVSLRHSISLALSKDMSKKINLMAPVLSYTKAESIKLALTMPGCYTALAYSHTAYDGKYPPRGKDHASVLRAHGFEEAGVPDPLVLRAVFEKKMDLPSTNNYKDGFIHMELGGVLSEDMPIKRKLELVEERYRTYYEDVRNEAAKQETGNNDQSGVQGQPG